MRSQRHVWLVALAAGVLCAANLHADDRGADRAEAAASKFDVPTSVTVLGTHVWVTDFANHRVHRLTDQGAHVLSWGSEGEGPGQFRGPAGVAVDRDGFVYVTDFYNRRLQKFTGDGMFVDSWIGPGGDLEPFRGPAGVAVDRNGRVFVADVDAHRVHVFRDDGTWLRSFGTTGYGDAGLVEPWGVGVDPAGRVMVTDRATGRIQVYTPEGEWLMGFGSWGADGLRGPTGVAADDEHVVVADFLNHRVATFLPDGRRSGAWSEKGAFLDVAIGAKGDVFAVDADRHQLVRLAHPKWGTEPTAVPGRFQLAIRGAQPSTGPTAMRLSLPGSGRVRVEILDVVGRRTRRLLEGALTAGEHSLTWDRRNDAGQHASPGIYFVTARFDDGKESDSIRRRIVVIQ